MLSIIEKVINCPQFGSFLLVTGLACILHVGIYIFVDRSLKYTLVLSLRPKWN